MLLVCLKHGPGSWSVDARLKQYFFMPNKTAKEKNEYLPE
jgi:hypothetical protein